MTTSAQTALDMLRESAAPEHDARIWHDNGRTIGRLARTAGARVVYVHCDLAAQTSEYRTVEGGAA